MDTRIEFPVRRPFMSTSYKEQIIRTISPENAYNLIKKYKDDSNLVVVYNIEQKSYSLYLSLELRQSQSKYTVIHLGDFGNYEIDFIQNNNELFMRLRDEIAALKNIEVTEFFFIKSNI